MDEVEIELFRADTPASRGITAADVQEAVQSFDGERNPMPVVMGHPKNDSSAPSYGAIHSVRQEGSTLFGTITKLAKEAVDGVRDKRILNRSVAFWHRDHPSNPTPGKLSLRHLGLLGGASPGIPNMAPLRFDAEAGDDGQLICDGEAGEPMIYAVEGEEGMQRVDLQELADAVAEKIDPAQFATRNPQLKDKTMTEEELKAAKAELDEKQARFAADQEAATAAATALEAREKAVADKEAEFAAAEKKAAEDAAKAREDSNVEFATQLVKDGKFPAGRKDDLVGVLNALPADSLTFSTGEADPAQALKDMLGGAQPQLIFAHITDDPSQFTSGDVPDDEKARLAAEEKRKTAHLTQK